MNQLTLTMRPHWEDGTVSYTEMEFTFPAEGLTGAPQLWRADQGFGGIIPFSEYDNFYLKDDLGDIPCEVKDIPEPYGPVTMKGIHFGRDAEGTVSWGYRLMPRVLPEGYRSSPYFDFRSEPDGMNGLGFFAFILPQRGTEFHAHVHWDLSEMPEGARGIFYSANDDFEADTNVDEFMMIYFASGVINAIEEGGFGTYWFGDTDFDMTGLAEKMAALFVSYSEFFHDENAVYRVFLRRDPFEYSGGGTAGTRSFLSGYSALKPVNVDAWFSTLAHELLHNWPAMTDEDIEYGLGTWYNEGCAEYYSTMLPLRAGITAPEYAAGQINNKVGERYLDIVQYRELSNKEILEVQWKDRIAQPIQYGKGCLYLANTDAKLRRLGKGSVDDIVSIHDKNDQITLDEWLKFIEDRLGEEGLKDFEDMKAGRYLTPDPDAFDGRFDCCPIDIEKDGKTYTSYRWKVREQ